MCNMSVDIRVREVNELKILDLKISNGDRRKIKGFFSTLKDRCDLAKGK